MRLLDLSQQTALWLLKKKFRNVPLTPRCRNTLDHHTPISYTPLLLTLALIQNNCQNYVNHLCLKMGEIKVL